MSVAMLTGPDTVPDVMYKTAFHGLEDLTSLCFEAPAMVSMLRIRYPSMWKMFHDERRGRQ